MFACDADEDTPLAEDPIPVNVPRVYGGPGETGSSPPYCEADYLSIYGSSIKREDTALSTIRIEADNRNCGPWINQDIASGTAPRLRAFRPDSTLGSQGLAGVGLSSGVLLQSNKCGQRLAVTMPGLNGSGTDESVTLHYPLPPGRLYSAIDFSDSNENAVQPLNAAAEIGLDYSDDQQLFLLATGTGQLGIFTTSWTEVMQGTVGTFWYYGELPLLAFADGLEDFAVLPADPENVTLWNVLGTYRSGLAVLGSRKHPCGNRYVLLDGQQPIGRGIVCHRVYFFESLSAEPIIQEIAVPAPEPGDDDDGDGKTLGDNAWGVDVDRWTGEFYVGSFGRLLQMRVFGNQIEVARYFIDNKWGQTRADPHWGREFALERRFLVSYNYTDPILGRELPGNSLSLWYLGDTCSELLQRYDVKSPPEARAVRDLSRNLSGPGSIGGPLIGLSLAPYEEAVTEPRPYTFCDGFPCELDDDPCTLMVGWLAGSASDNATCDAGACGTSDAFRFRWCGP